ncbi:MAG: hypothetical protein QM703_01335 [Gemmatales bacterium]
MTTIWLGLFFLVAGCSDPKSMNPPETIVVSGKALQPSGQPISGGRIRFSPVYGAEGAEAYADIKPDGTFTLQSFGGRDGAMPGTYKVALSGKAMTGIAAKYQDPETSTLKVEITKDKKDLGAIKFQ